MENNNWNVSRHILWSCVKLFPTGKIFISNFIKPFGTIFINLLKLIAIPLILASLIKGVSDLKDISKLSKMGGRTIITFICLQLLLL